MQQTKKIMVGMAFTEYSQGIFNYAAMLASAFDAQILAVNIINERDVAAVARVESMGYDVDGGHFVSTIRENRNKTLDGIVAKSGFPADRVSRAIAVGNPMDELLKIALDEQVDMIVLGVKGRTDLEHVFVGSVAEKIFRRSPIPVVSYRGKSIAAKLRKRLE